METKSSEVNQSVKFRLTGQVQGVGLRNWMLAEARKRSLSGWVRNESDGSVGVLLIGHAEMLANATEWLCQGTAKSEVIDICELSLDDLDLNWDASAGFNIINE